MHLSKWFFRFGYGYSLTLPKAGQVESTDIQFGQIGFLIYPAVTSYNSFL